MAAFDYSKWDKIELSDDESDCHPNIDKESWFRMKHRTRVEREQREEKERSDLEKENAADLKRVLQLKELLRAIDSGNEVDEAEDPVAISNEIKALDASIEKRNKKLADMEKNKKWNWENMCHVVEERTILTSEEKGEGKDTMVRTELPPKLQAVLNKPSEKVPAKPGPASAKEELMNYSQFVEKYENLLERFSEIDDLEKTEEFLLKEGGVLFAEHAQNYLLLSCLEDEMNNKHRRAELVAHQSQVLSNITELAVGLRRPPQDVVKPFFRRLNEKPHRDAFDSAVKDFVMRVKERAKVKRQEMAEEEYVELSKEERLGPGGLDPLEVYESLPKKMQEAFDSKNVEDLKLALAELTQEEREYHMKRCEGSGLWVTGGSNDDED